MRSISWKYSICMMGDYAPLAATNSSDAGGEVFQDEILLGGRLAVVDLLGPLLQRQLDAKRLVDRERDVEKIQAVDSQIVDRVALRRDRVARDVAGFSDNRGDLIECGRHH